MPKIPTFPDTPLEHSSMRNFMRSGFKLEPTADTLQLGSVAVSVTLDADKTTLLSATAGAQYNLPDGEFPGQLKHLVADVSGSGTAVASTAALAKLCILGAVGEDTDTITALTFDADNEYAVLQWTGAKWNVLYATATVTPTG
jgi:hypothetical protein